jgi:hypothetical protein
MEVDRERDRAGEVTAVAAATGSKDPEVALAAVAALRALVRCWRP